MSADDPMVDPLVTIKIPSSRLRDMVSALSQVLDRGFAETHHYPTLRELRDTLTVDVIEP
jgi:hypothetical protein